MEAELSTAAQVFLAVNLGAFFISVVGVMGCMAHQADDLGGFFVLTGAISFVLLIIFAVGHI